MARLLFASSFFYKLDPKQWSFHQPYPPLGTLLAAAVARELNHEVSLFDATLASSPSEIAQHIQLSKPSTVIIYDDGFNYLTKMCLTVMREASFVMIGLAKAAGCSVVVCGSDSSDHYDKYFDEGADYVIRGEGEQTLKDFLSSGINIENTPGLAYRSKGNTVVNAARPVIRHLDDLPLPAWDLADIEAYRSVWMTHHGYFSMNIATTRGCPFKCNWCAKPIYGNRYNSRSPQHVVEEISFLLNTYRPDHFWMCDDIFGLKPTWVQQFRDEVRKRNLKFRYKIQSRVDLLLEQDTVDALKESGVETVWVGAESGSQKILDAMDKGTKVAQIYDATRAMKQKGIKVSFFLQFGYPGEVKADIDATLKMVLDLMPDEIGISVSYPLPGTLFFENVKSQLSGKQNWKDSNDLAMMFRNTYSPGFYRILYHYVHGCYRLKRGLNYMAAWLKKPLATLPNARRILSVPYYFVASTFHAYRLRKTS
jgi:anaerobic magnesium-protoporphyrin IX monomethyl ester cyclase